MGDFNAKPEVDALDMIDGLLKETPWCGEKSKS